MEIYKEILLHALMCGELKVTIPSFELSQIVEGNCYRTLQRIKAILEDDTLEDVECFHRIEEIVLALEDIGVCAEGRHDFG